MPGLLAAANSLIGISPQSACDPSRQSCAPGSVPAKCKSTQCLTTLAEQAKFEKENNCTFPASACGEFNKDTQCCGKDPRTGKPKVVEKVMTTKGVITKGADSFTWTNYTTTCPNKKQNEAPPNALWKKCEVGKKHSPDDDYKIIEVQKNGIARDYCIDGCSIPPVGVAGALAAGIFLVPDRNNPAGHSASSFYQACAKHDICYQTCDKDQDYCDTRLKEDATTSCQNIPANHSTNVMRSMGGIVMLVPVNTRVECEKIAKTFVFVLNDLEQGRPAFNLRRQQYCQCC